MVASVSPKTVLSKATDSIEESESIGKEDVKKVVRFAPDVLERSSSVGKVPRFDRGIAQLERDFFSLPSAESKEKRTRYTQFLIKLRSVEEGIFDEMPSLFSQAAVAHLSRTLLMHSLVSSERNFEKDLHGMKDHSCDDKRIHGLLKGMVYAHNLETHLSVLLKKLPETDSPTKLLLVESYEKELHSLLEKKLETAYCNHDFFETIVSKLKNLEKIKAPLEQLEPEEIIHTREVLQEEREDKITACLNRQRATNIMRLHIKFQHKIGLQLPSIESGTFARIALLTQSTNNCHSTIRKLEGTATGMLFDEFKNQVLRQIELNAGMLAS